MEVNVNLRNVQEQVGENGEQVRKYAHKAALAYAGLWAMAYDSTKAGLESSMELLEKAEKRGEEVEQEVNKQYHKYYEQAMDEFKKLQERYGGDVDLEEVGKKYYGQAMDEVKKLQERYGGNLDLEEFGKSMTKAVSGNAKFVQGNVGKALEAVGIAGARKDVEEKVIEVTAETMTEVKAAMAPIEGYDEMTAKDLIAKFDGMDDELLALIRAYEAKNKNRITVLRELDERLGEPVAA